MRYFNETASGEDREQDEKPYTFEEIAEALQSIGYSVSEKTARARIKNLVEDIAVALFGQTAAILLESGAAQVSQ